MIIIVLLIGYIIPTIILIVLHKNYLHRTYLKNLKKLRDYEDKMLKELSGGEE